MKWCPNEHEKMENLIKEVIRYDMDIKCFRGYIYEIRRTEIGDSTKFWSNGKNYSIKMNAHSIDVDDILATEKRWTDKGDAIAFRIIELINKRVTHLIQSSEISADLATLKGCVKIVIDNNPIVTNDGVANIKFGAELFIG